MLSWILSLVLIRNIFPHCMQRYADEPLDRTSWRIYEHSEGFYERSAGLLTTIPHYQHLG